jgi:hypothetical protein
MMMADFIFGPAVAFMVGCSLYFGPRINSDRMAMQWGFNGEPTWRAPKAIGLWGMVAFAVAVRALIWAAMTYLPENVHGAETGLLLSSIIVAATHVLILRAAARAN